MQQGGARQGAGSRSAAVHRGLSPNCSALLPSLDSSMSITRRHNTPPPAVGNSHLGEYHPYGPFYQEHKMHFALWALMKSPLMVGHDLRRINQSSLDLLLKKVGHVRTHARSRWRGVVAVEWRLWGWVAHPLASWWLSSLGWGRGEPLGLELYVRRPVASFEGSATYSGVSPPLPHPTPPMLNACPASYSCGGLPAGDHRHQPGRAGCAR